MEFIGREAEQKSIDYLLNKTGYSGCVIYGRRRLGKSELIKHCILKNNIKSIVYQCKESSEYENVQLISELIKKEFNLNFIKFETFFEALSFVFEWSLKENVCLVLDEYPYIRELIDGCDSKLQEQIDNYSNKSNLKLFLIGSSISTMEDVLTQNNPLYGRFNLSFLLKQMDYYDSSKFYPSFSNEDKIALYSVFGGVPFYNIQIDSNQTVKENIIRIVSGQFSGLKDFIEIYLKSELRKINNANIVFDVIAHGAFHYSDILSKSHIEVSSQLSSILQKLIKMDLIEYVSPINDKSNKQKAGYVISDSSLKFYYQFIYRNESSHKILSDDLFYDKFIKSQLESIYIPRAFENICKQFLIRQNKLGNINPILLDIGSYWYDLPQEKRNGQFDVVARSEDGYIFYECKYTNNPIDDKVINEEIDQVNKTNLNPIGYGFFSKNGYKLDKNYPYKFYSLEDIYK